MKTQLYLLFIILCKTGVLFKKGQKKPAMIHIAKIVPTYYTCYMHSDLVKYNI